MKSSWTRGWRRGLGVAVLIVALAAVDLTVWNTFGWAGHVAWSELGQFNIETFEKQLREALPVGMPKSSVEAYLKREKIPFTYEDGIQPFLWVRKKDAHRALLWIPGDLSIHVELDRDLKVSEIRFGLKYK